MRYAGSVNTTLPYLSNQILYPLVQVTYCSCWTVTVQGC